MERDEVLVRLEEEIRIRPAAVGEVEFLELSPPLGGEWPIAQGTLLVIWTAETAQLAEARSLALAGRTDELSQLLNRAPNIVEEEIVTTGDIFDHVEAIGELLYGGRSIVTGATTPPWTSPSLDRVTLPFAGGALEAHRFTTRSFVLPGSVPLSFLVIANPAETGPDEARILNALGEEQVGLGIEPANTLIVGAIAGAVATAVVGHYTDKATDRVDRDVAQWANNREREQQRERREANAQWKNQQAAERVRYRNAGFVPGDTLVAGPSGDPPATLQELLAARREMLGLAARAEFPEVD